ncbi:MAG: hypothetical protein ACD_19C00164G0003 [uncultured bacterium]|nr:MAG: hypothetical protein ACD_19C00164G0003 [uncultured bacterium]
MALPAINLDIDIKSETVSKALDMLAKAGHVFYEPTAIKRKASAESEASIIKAKTAIKVTELQHQALNRLLSLETSRQININSLSQKALTQIALSGQKIDESTEVDWIKKYFSFSQDVSNEDMQTLWARVMAGEFTKAGSFSYKTMSILANMRKEEAELFALVCTFVVDTGKRLVPLIYDSNSGEIKKFNHAFSFEDLQFLQSLGLVHFNDIGEYNVTTSSKDFLINDSKKSLLISSNIEGKNVFNVGKVLLTKEGQEMCTIVNPERSPNLGEIINSKLVTGERTITEL